MTTPTHSGEFIKEALLPAVLARLRPLLASVMSRAKPVAGAAVQRGRSAAGAVGRFASTVPGAASAGLNKAKALPGQYETWRRDLMDTRPWTRLALPGPGGIAALTALGVNEAGVKPLLDNRIDNAYEQFMNEMQSRSGGLDGIKASAARDIAATLAAAAARPSIARRLILSEVNSGTV